MAGSARDFQQLWQSCIDDGLLVPAFGRDNFRISKRGTEVVKRAAATDAEVASALEEALQTRWRERREALVALVLFARERGF